MKVYIVMIDWACDNEYGNDCRVYSNFQSAYEAFNQTIEDECNPEYSWVGNEVFDENGDVYENYELLCNTDREITTEEELYWDVADTKWGSRYTNISLKIKEVLE